MTDAVRLAVLGTGVWMPGFPTLESWRAGDPQEEDAPKGQALGRIQKRRAGRMARAVSDATHAAMLAGELAPEGTPVVVGSALGEATTMISILDDMFRRQSEASPASFAVSVHNAASGLMSIGYKNRGFATSIAADHDTPGAALLEAAGLVLTEGCSAVVVCADEGIPADFLSEEGAWDLVAAAVAIGPQDAPGARGHITVPALAAREPSLPSAQLPERVASNPQIGLVDLIAAIEERATGVLRLDRGAGRGYSVELS